jgi:hypothetical protein
MIRVFNTFFCGNVSKYYNKPHTIFRNFKL